jgi:hypothetical protein
MDKNCQELLDNIKRTLHECRDNKKTIEITEMFDINKCYNVSKWRKTIKVCIPLKVVILNSIVKNKYSIEYKVNQRSLVIS